MQLSQMRFQESEGGSLAVTKLHPKGVNRRGEEKDMRDNTGTGQSPPCSHQLLLTSGRLRFFQDA